MESNLIGKKTRSAQALDLNTCLEIEGSLRDIDLTMLAFTDIVDRHKAFI